jgi:signal transduction histidine kinase
MHNSLKSITRSRHQNGDGKISIIVRNKARKLKNNSGQNISKTEPTVEIIVDDNGQGIDPKIMSVLFKKFTRSLDGNGLGLYISKKIIEAHGGKISVKNKKKMGAAFTIILPLDSPDNINKH